MTGARHLHQLRKLQQITALLQEAALADLARKTQACEDTRRQIRDLSAPLPADSTLPLGTLEQAALRHHRWADPRRLRLNEQLALQIAHRIDAAERARRELGRAEALAGIAAALAARQRPRK